MLTSLRKSSSVSSFCMYSLLQVYGIVHRVSFIFHLNVFLLSVCARGFGYLLCWPRGRRIGLVCTRRFSFCEFYNFLLSNFLIFIFFWKTFFLPTTITHTHTHTHDPRPTTHDPRPTTHDPRPTTFSYTLRITTQIWVVTRYQYGISALFFRRHLAGKPVVASPNVGCFLRLLLYSFVGKTLWQKLSVSKSLSFLWSHVSLNSSICQSEEGWISSVLTLFHSLFLASMMTLIYPL